MIELGQVRQSQLKRGEFELINESRMTAHVYLRSGCGCTTLGGVEFSLQPQEAVDVPVEVKSAVAGRRATFVTVHVVPEDGTKPYEFDVQIIAEVEPALEAEVVDTSVIGDGLPTLLVRLTPAAWATATDVVGVRSNFAVFDTATESVEGRGKSVRLTATRRLDGFAPGDTAVVTVLTDSPQAPSVDLQLPARLLNKETQP